jgi:group I intron endonuclease
MSIIPPTVYTLYQYTNRSNGKRYIGVTKDPITRADDHAKGRSKARAFNAAVKKYGIDNFDYAVLAIFDDAEAASYHEQITILSIGTLAPYGYNLRAGAPYTKYGGTFSSETRAKLSAANKGQIPWTKGNHHSIETRAKISAANKGRKQTPEQRAQNSECHKGQITWMKGKHHTPEAIEKNRIAHIGKSHPHTPESRAKLRAARMKQPHPFLGKVPTAEHRAKISAALKGHSVSPETRAKMGSGAWKNRGKHRSDEARARMSVAAKAREERKREARKAQKEGD